MITFLVCPNANGFHEMLYMYCLIPDGEEPIYYPTYKQWCEVNDRRPDSDIIAYFFTCPSCISKGCKPRLERVQKE